MMEPMRKASSATMDCQETAESQPREAEMCLVSSRMDGSGEAIAKDVA
jgi:hypothetical protein